MYKYNSYIPVVASQLEIKNCKYAERIESVHSSHCTTCFEYVSVALPGSHFSLGKFILFHSSYLITFQKQFLHLRT